MEGKIPPEFISQVTQIAYLEYRRGKMELYKERAERIAEFLLDPLGWLTRRSQSILAPGGRYIDAELQALKARKREELIARGYPETMVVKALDWAEYQALQMAKRGGGGDPRLEDILMRNFYLKNLEDAERWIIRLREAFGWTGP